MNLLCRGPLPRSRSARSRPRLCHASRPSRRGRANPGIPGRPSRQAIPGRPSRGSGDFMMVPIYTMALIACIPFHLRAQTHRDREHWHRPSVARTQEKTSPGLRRTRHWSWSSAWTAGAGKQTGRGSRRVLGAVLSFRRAFVLYRDARHTEKARSHREGLVSAVLGTPDVVEAALGVGARLDSEQDLHLLFTGAPVPKPAGWTGSRARRPLLQSTRGGRR